MRHLQFVLCISLVLAGAALGNTQPEVTNVVAVQRPHTALVDVTYDLFDADGDALHVTLWYSLDGGASWDHQCVTVWGDVGPGIMSGEGLTATWDAGVDLANHIDQQFLIRVYADDGNGNGEVSEGFVYITPGNFMMGSPLSEPDRNAENETQHQVTLTHGFYMSKYQVTEEWWHQIMGGAPTNPQLPKNQIGWDMAIEFCNILSVQQGFVPAYTINESHITWNQSADGYRLPTEAEWEYACRAGTTAAYNNDTNCLFSNTEANFRGNSYQLPGCPTGIWRQGRIDVGSFPANQWGLYDMHGNVYDWVWDSYRADYHNLDPIDPVFDDGPGSARVFRGGGWYSIPAYCRSAFRPTFSPGSAPSGIGFRPVRTVFESP